jgi:hypothetical protein
MRIRLTELRRLIRQAIKEDNRPTISSDLDPGEKELKDKFSSWGSPASRREIKQDNPAMIKTKKVTAILQQQGLTANAENKKKITHDLLPFIQNMDPADAFVMGPEEIAAKFAEEVLDQRSN